MTQPTPLRPCKTRLDALMFMRGFSRRAHAALVQRYSGTCSSKEIAFVFIHYLYGLAGTAMDNDRPEAVLDAMRELATSLIQTEDFDFAMKASPRSFREPIPTIAVAVEAYGKRDASHVRKPIDLDEITVIEPNMPPSRHSL